MKYTGIDYHKRYSVACTLDEQGRRVHEARIDANTPEDFAAYFKTLTKRQKRKRQKRGQTLHFALDP